MSVSLQKGQNLSLTKAAPGLSNITVGLGWDARMTEGDAFDLDATVFLLGSDGKVRKDEDFVFYNNPASPCGSVRHTGDNLTGEGEGDDEQVKVDLTRVPEEVFRIRFAASIHEGTDRIQTFGMVNNAFIRVVNDADQNEIARFDLTEDASIEMAMIFGEIYRHNGEWKFRAVGQGFQHGLAALARDCGVNL